MCLGQWDSATSGGNFPVILAFLAYCFAFVKVSSNSSTPSYLILFSQSLSLLWQHQLLLSPLLSLVRSTVIFSMLQSKIWDMPYLCSTLISFFTSVVLLTTLHLYALLAPAFFLPYDSLLTERIKTEKRAQNTEKCSENQQPVHCQFSRNKGCGVTDMHLNQ